MDLLFWIAVFIASLAVLTKSADIFTTNSEKLGKILGLPQFIIGISIVALGTSLPEFTTSILANIQGYSSFAAANVVGTNIANILFALGIGAVVARKLSVEKNLIMFDLPIYVAVTALLIVTIYDGSFGLLEASLMILTYGVYVAYNFSEHRRNMIEKLSKKVENTVNPPKLDPKIMLWILFSAIGVFLGAKYTVDSVVNIAEGFGIPLTFISITAVALGTSLPEIVVGLIAAHKGNHEMVIGNVIGSNIFNASMGMAIPAFFGTLNVTNDVITIGIPFLIISAMLLTLSGLERKILSYEGVMYMILYIVFIAQLTNF